jgi:predicted TIM-barrel fold metal-dependent hydrolase
MPHDPHDWRTINRRSFVKASLIPAVLPLATSLGSRFAQGAEPAPAGPDIIDSNVHLFEWPFRKLKYNRTEALIGKLRKHRITKAWAGSFEAVLHKQLDPINRHLAEECRTRGGGVLVPIGSVNPAWPDWEEDLRRCHEQHRMPGVRLYPAYHGYALDHPQFMRLLAHAAKRGLLVQIVLRMEDERVHHQAISIGAVNVSPLVDALKKVPQAKVQLINSAGPLLGNNVSSLARETQVTFDIAATEGNGGVGRLIEGKNLSYRGAIPVERLLFGSHAPYFPCETAVFKLFESPLSLDQLGKLMSANARRLIS